MSLVAEYPFSVRLGVAEPPAGAENDIRTAVWGVLASLAPPRASRERRQDRRYPFAQLIRLTPLASDGRPLVDESLVVAGKHLSERGLGFFHPLPLAQRRVVASLEVPGGQRLHLLVDVNWCRFTRQGWYESGGRFLSLADDPRALGGAG